MIKGIQTVRAKDLQTALVTALLPSVVELLESRGPGHCMRIADLDLELMLELTQALRQRVNNSQVYVLTEATTCSDEYYVTSTKLVELRNPDESGVLRPPLLVFVPNNLKTSSEDSFGIATFESVDVSHAYRVVFDDVLASAPNAIKEQVREVKFLLEDRAQRRISDYQWARYLLTFKLNDFDPCVLGTGLFELKLIPDLTLHDAEVDLARRLVANTRSVDVITASDKTAIATVYDLQLDGELFNKRLATFLNEFDIGASTYWLKQIVVDSANWDLSFDKWVFQYEREAVDAICITVGDVALPSISESETNPNLQPLIGHKVLTVGAGGLKKFGLTFTVDPAPDDVRGLAKFQAQVFSQQGDFVGLIKAAKATTKSTLTINFTKLTGVNWDEGWHYVRVQALDEGDELIPLVDEHGSPIPWGTSKEDEAGSRPNESDLFYVIPAEETDVEPLPGRKPKEDSLAHGKLKLQFASLLDSDALIQPEIKEISWLDTNNKSEELLDIQFLKLAGVQISVSSLLKSLEQRIIAEPMMALGWRAEIKDGEFQSEAVIDYADWPTRGVEDVFSAFEVSRKQYLAKIVRDDVPLISVAHDFSTSSVEARDYADTYLAYLSALYARIEEGDAGLTLDDLVPVLRLDALNITVWDIESSVKQVVLLGPTHPLRVMWLTGWSQLGEYWLNQSKGLSKDLIIGARNGLNYELALANFPYVLPTANGELLVALDNLHPFWTVYTSSQEPEPQALMDTLVAALGISRPQQRQQSNSGQYLATKFERYLIQHPYVRVLTVNVFNAGNATAVADTLLALEKRADLKHVRYDIRLFVADPFAAGVGADLLALLAIESDLTAMEADQFSRSSGSHMHPKLSVSVRAIEDFVKGADRYSSHLSLLFDVFPAEEIAVVDQAADERVAPVHGLYQDYCVEYSEENGLVTWDRYTRHGIAKPAFGNDFTEPLSVLPQLMATLTATVATGKFSTQHVPVVRLALNSAERALLNQLHEVSDWVFTVDRNLGIEFFDHGGKEGRPDYLIDHSPEMAANNGHNFVITSRSTTEIQALLSNTLERYHLSSDAASAARVLDALRALSGRLALKLVSNSASKAEALGLALSKMYLDYQGVFHNQIVVPLDAHLELYNELQQNAEELGDSHSLKRTDLALFDMDAKNKTVRCNLVEVKCYADVGDMSSYSKLKESIAQQISQSERVLQQHFDPHRTSPDRPDRLVRTQKLCVLLEHYLKRSMRFGLLDSEASEEAKYLLRTLEDGYMFVVTRSAVVFDFAQDGSGKETEAGIEYHRVGRQYIIDLLAADVSAELPVEDESLNDKTEASLSSLELTIPKLSEAAFLHTQRERSVTWDEIVKSAESKLVKPVLQPIEVVELSAVRVDDDLKKADVAPEVKEELIVDDSAAVNENNTNNQQPEPEPEENEMQDTSAVAENPDLIPDIMLGVNDDSAQFGVLGEVAGRSIALDLNHTHTISLFGVQGGGKSYTLGTVVEMATMPIPAINNLSKALASVIFHYSATQDYKPEFTSMIAPNDDEAQLSTLKKIYGAEPQSLSDVVLLTPEDKLEQRKAEYPGIEVHPLKFCSAELQASHWKFLMGAVGNQAAYIRQLGNIMRKNRNILTLEGIRNGVENSSMPDSLKELANMRLDFAEQYIDDTANVSQLAKPGRMIIVDLRDEFIEKDEALGLFVVLLQIFSEAKYKGEAFNKLIVFDECHKYIDSPDLVKGLVETVREMRHKGTSVMIASQDPPSVPVELIELSTQIILHKFNSPAWLKHVQKASVSLSSLTPEKLNNLQAGEAYIWSSKASDNSFTKGAYKIKCRPRVTKHGGDTLTAI
jgi:DNA phosphorothioation-dependent restriction protein DptH